MWCGVCCHCCCWSCLTTSCSARSSCVSIRGCCSCCCPQLGQYGFSLFVLPFVLSILFFPSVVVSMVILDLEGGEGGENRKRNLKARKEKGRRSGNFFLSARLLLEFYFLSFFFFLLSSGTILALSPRILFLFRSRSHFVLLSLSNCWRLSNSGCRKSLVHQKKKPSKEKEEKKKRRGKISWVAVTAVLIFFRMKA